MVEVATCANCADMLALQGNKEIGNKISKVIAKVAEANNQCGVIDQTDFNDPVNQAAGKIL